MTSAYLLLLSALVAVCSANEHWALTQSNTTCIVIDSEPSGEISIAGLNETREFNIKYQTISGSCKELYQKKNAQIIHVQFSPEKSMFDEAETDTEPWILTLIFLQEGEENYELADWNLEAYLDNNKTIYEKGEKAETFRVPITAGYMCSSFHLSLQNNSVINFKSFAAVAFGKLDGDKLPANLQICPFDNHTNKVVPIVVGCLLAGLVCGVLVAYFIGRRRARIQGYSSV